MPLKPVSDGDLREMPEPQGHLIGFVNSEQECDAIARSLNLAGFPDSAMLLLSGEDGSHLLRRMMEGSLWGEAAEETLKQGLAEIAEGHFVFVIEEADRDNAKRAVDLATAQGGHGFSLFGILADERLTK